MNVVFDFGAVLFTWQPVQLVQLHFGHLAPTVDAARALATSIFHHDDWLGFDRGTHALDDVLQRTARRLDLPHDKLDALLTPMGERLLPIADTLSLLAALRERRDSRGDVQLYFLSNMPVPYARLLEQRYDFLRWFDGGIFSGDVKLIKPQREIYELMATRHGLQAAHTVFIDDMPANVEAAREFGWQGIHFENPAQLARRLAIALPP
jgi:putative hydrolase of the HAD superfamily